MARQVSWRAQRSHLLRVKIHAHLEYTSLRDVPELVGAAERTGFDGVWFPETSHEPFLGAALACEHTTRATVGTNVAIALTRSPTLLAHLAWDLAALSGGRFILGLGTQVRAHVERRFGMPWDAPAPRLRDTVRAIRAVWDTWRTGRPLAYRGRGYALSLMTPFFTPPRHDHPIPVATAGVNPVMCRVAGEVADAFQVHPLHTPAYLRDVVLPAIRRGQARADRTALPIRVNASVFVVTDPQDAHTRGEVKQAIAFYASTPSYRGVLAHHGWEEIGARLSVLARSGRWAAMAAEVPDEMLETVAVLAPLSDAGARIRERYAGLADAVGPYAAFSPARADTWRALIAGIRG